MSAACDSSAARLRAAADDVVAALDDIADAQVRALEAEALIEVATEIRGRIAEVRRTAIRDMRDSGLAWVEIGRRFGVTGARAQQIAEGKGPR